MAANRKWFSSLAAPCRVCSGATWLPRELSWKTHRWVIETLSCPSLIPSQTKSYSQKSSSVQSLRQVSLGSCAFLGAPPESVFKHEHIFNQARKSVKYKVHPALELQGTALSPWWRSPAGQFIPVAPKSSSLCAWLHFPSGREEQTSRKSCWLTDTQAPNARWIALFFFPLMKEVFPRSIHQRRLYSRAIWDTKQRDKVQLTPEVDFKFEYSKKWANCIMEHGERTFCL